MTTELTTDDISPGTELVYQTKSVDYTTDRDYSEPVRGTVVEIVEETKHLVGDTMEQTLVIIETADGEEKRVNINHFGGDSDTRVGIIPDGDEDDDEDDDEDEGPHTCDECGEELESEHGVAVHKGIVHSDDEGDEPAADDAPVAIADGGREQVEFDLDIDYLAAFEDEIEEATVPATASREDDMVRISTPDNELRLTTQESDGVVSLYGEYTNDGYDHDQPAYVKDRDDCRLSVSWEHNDQHVDEIVLGDDAGELVLAMLDERRAAQDHWDVETAWTATGVEIPDLDLEVVETTVSRGRRSTSTELTVIPADHVDSDRWERWRDIVQRAGNHQTTHYKSHMFAPEHQGYEAGDAITLHDLIDEWHAIDARDVAREADLADLDIDDDLSVGDIVTVVNGRRRDELTERQGVVRDIGERGAEITWDGRNWSKLKRDDDGQLRIGRAVAGGYSPVRNLDVHSDPDDVDDDLLEAREAAIESAEIDRRADAYDVTTEQTWKGGSSVEASRASDLHAELTVDGPGLEGPVSVHCRNVFDFGWTATIKDDLDEETAALVRRAARNNSPIPTEVRL
jgi:hypothetical protein